MTLNKAFKNLLDEIKKKQMNVTSKGKFDE